MLIQIPRLTSSLRGPFDVDQAYLQLKHILQNRESRNSASSLDDSVLARKIVYKWEEASSEVRQAYKQFIVAVVQLIDQETPSEEFHDVVLTLYRLFSSQMAEDDIDRIISDKKLELRKLLGHTVADANLRQVASLAQTLLKVQPSNDVERNLDASEDLEFGADFNFVAPACFLIDVTLDIEDMMDYKGTAPLAVQEGHYGHIGPTDHSVVDGAKFNLSWLRDACDKIVRNSLLQLSRDELAMPFVGVLDSEKPGEEIAGDLLDLVGDSAFETVQDLILGLWFDKDSALWMLPCMNADLISSLSRNGISTVQQLLDIPKAALPTVTGNFPSSKLYQK